MSNLETWNQSGQTNDSLVTYSGRMWGGLNPAIYPWDLYHHHDLCVLTSCYQNLVGRYMVGWQSSSGLVYMIHIEIKSIQD